MCVEFLAKVLLCLISIVITLLGVAFIVVGSLMLSNENYLADLLEKILNGNIQVTEIIEINEMNRLLAPVLLGIGIALFIIGFIGLCSSQGRRCFIFLYISILTLLTLVEIGASIYLSTPPGIDMVTVKFEDMMFSKLKDTSENITLDAIVPNNNASASWSAIQIQFQCCGSRGYDDYKDWKQEIFVGTSGVVSARVPPSCCQLIDQTIPDFKQAYNTSSYSNIPECIAHAPRYTNIKGCAKELLSLINQQVNAAILVFTSAAAIQLICSTISIVIYASGSNNGRKTSTVV